MQKLLNFRLTIIVQSLGIPGCKGCGTNTEEDIATKCSVCEDYYSLSSDKTSCTPATCRDPTDDSAKNKFIANCATCAATAAECNSVFGACSSDLQAAATVCKTCEVGYTLSADGSACEVRSFHFLTILDVIYHFKFIESFLYWLIRHYKICFIVSAIYHRCQITIFWIIFYKLFYSFWTKQEIVCDSNCLANQCSKSSTCNVGKCQEFYTDSSADSSTNTCEISSFSCQKYNGGSKQNHDRCENNLEKTNVIFHICNFWKRFGSHGESFDFPIICDFGLFMLRSAFISY